MIAPPFSWSTPTTRLQLQLDTSTPQDVEELALMSPVVRTLATVHPKVQYIITIIYFRVLEIVLNVNLQACGEFMITAYLGSLGSCQP